MAAPADRTLRDFTGKYAMNKQLSDSPEPVLALQGIGYLVRKGISMASVHLEVNEYQAPPKPPNTSTDIFFHVDIEQTAAGLTSTQERRCIDGEWRPHNDWLFGDVKGKTEWLSLNDLDDDFLKQGWEPQSDDPTAKNYIVSHVESQTNGWTARQVWGFQIVDGLRRYTRAIVVTKGSERVAVHLYYDYLGSA